MRIEKMDESGAMHDCRFPDHETEYMVISGQHFTDVPEEIEAYCEHHKCTPEEYKEMCLRVEKENEKAYQEWLTDGGSF